MMNQVQVVGGYYGMEYKSPTTINFRNCTLGIDKLSLDLAIFNKEVDFQKIQNFYFV